MNSAHTFMDEAIALAEKGMRNEDGGPFGAIVVREDMIIGRGWNKVLSSNDPTAHAEVVAIRDACKRTGDYWLEGCHLYVNCEPCPMCLAAIYWARIEYVTFAASRKDAASIGFDDDLIYRQVCLPIAERSLITAQCNRNESLKIMNQWPAFGAKKRY